MFSQGINEGISRPLVQGRGKQVATGPSECIQATCLCLTVNCTWSGTAEDEGCGEPQTGPSLDCHSKSTENETFFSEGATPLRTLRTGTGCLLTHPVDPGGTVLTEAEGRCGPDQRKPPRWLREILIKRIYDEKYATQLLWWSIWKHSCVSWMAGNSKKISSATKNSWALMCRCCLDWDQMALCLVPCLFSTKMARGDQVHGTKWLESLEPTRPGTADKHMEERGSPQSHF